MSRVVRPVTRAASRSPQEHHDTWVKSYRYLRTAMVGLLVGLGVAVLHQTWRQGFDLLSSVSAYYYTPAQAIFVGSLIGLGACMIALKGTTDVEDVFLNLGGMLAAVVAVVPTARDEDYRAAVRACAQADTPPLTPAAPPDLDCPSIRALVEATRANVENSVTSLLVVGFLALLATVIFFARITRRSHVGAVSTAKFWRGFAAAVMVWLAGLVTFWAFRDWFIDRAHYIAAAGLFLCIFVVAVENARRHQRAQSGDASGPGETPTRVGVLISPRRQDRYAWIARVMLVVAVAGVVLWLAGAIALFWLETSVAALFAVFWMVQTIEQLPDPGAEPPPAS